MKRQERADRIGEILDELYPTVEIPLDHRNDFTLLIAVLLSAQTTDKKVNEVTPALFDRASTAREMATVGVEEIQHFIRQVGLAPTKARNISKLSIMLVELHGGEVPKDIEALEELPGVGHKTASVVMAQAFGIPAFPVDTHIHRLAHRWNLTRGKNVTATEADLKKLFPEETWNLRHVQIIYFGRGHCPALYHDLKTCPICGWAATKKRIAEEARTDRERRKR